MGLAGLGLAWRVAAQNLAAPAMLGEVVLALALDVFVLLISSQIFRVVVAPVELITEWSNLARRNFFCAATISSSLLSLGLLPYSRRAAECLWIAGVTPQLVFFVLIIRRWFLEEVNLSELNPAWLIPMVGNASPSFAGVSLGCLQDPASHCNSLLGSFYALDPLSAHIYVPENPRAIDARVGNPSVRASGNRGLNFLFHSRCE
ncbi:C4-dicarboxylate transporter/malic acid transport protein [compost metagenome]